MPKVTAWQCPKTGSLFLKTDDYRRHRCRIAAERAFAKKRKAKMAAMDAKLSELHKQTSFEEIEQWIMDNSDFLWLRAFDTGQIRFWGKNKKVRKVPKGWKITNVRLEGMHWSDSVSNSHSAPIGKPTNWGGKEGLPKGYPGWRGNIEFTIEGRDDSLSGSDPFRGTGINTGSGGGGSRGNYRYGVELFADDFIHLLMMLKLEGRFENGNTRFYR